MTPSLRRALIILPFWIATLAWMWSWWITSGAVRFLPLFIPLTLAMLYEFAILPSAFLYFVVRAKSPKRRIAQKNLKVAVISLCVPSSESLDIVQKQLEAMSKITYPHDSWILDEGGSAEIRTMAKRYGVKYFSRKGVPKYNQPIPPFQQKTKAGNVNAWLNHVKRRKYDYFVQLDIDHIPQPRYLDKTLGYFRDPRVAWVQAPSVYKNRDSWIARGAAEQELVLQGPLQMGFYGHSQTPFIIGSHCTYRMSAIREIGGFQPTRAEDHLDTLHLAHNGYKGVFLPEVIAEGDGPETLDTYLAQQFAWAYSMFQVLIGHSPRTLKGMSRARKWQFLFAQSWYPLWELYYLVMFLTPLLALLINRDVMHVQPGQMLVHFLPLYLMGYLVWWSAKPLMQPRNLWLSWRGIIMHAVRWPIILRAILAATFKVKKPYMITPKGSYAQAVPSVVTYRPFLILGLMSLGGVLFTSTFRSGGVPESQVIFAITNAVFMLTICSVDLATSLREATPKFSEIRRDWSKPIIAVFALMLILVATLDVSYRTGQSRALAASVPAVNMQTPQPANYNMTTQQLIQQISLVPASTKAEPKIGMYVPTLEIPNNTTPYIQHSFVDWRDDHYFALVLAKSLQSGNTPLITVEPRGSEDGAKLLADISSGAYDGRLDNLAKAVKASKNPVYIRFGHEMDLGNLYPWGNQDPTSYVNAYQHMVNRLRLADGATNARFVWSPAGSIGASQYYPGDGYVDVIGTTILYDQYWYGGNLPTFDQIAQDRQWLEGYGKPVWVVEFGAGRANPAFQQTLINDALTNYTKDGFQALVYLNMKDANLAGPDYTLYSLNEFGNFFLQ